MSRVAVLGLGAMGSRMARNLLKASHEVIIYNRTEARSAPLTAAGAVAAASPREAAERSEIVLAIVSDDNASKAIWLDPERGAARGLREGSMAIESSTLTVAWVKELAAAVSARGARFLDAPVVGSRPQAEAAQLLYLVGGEEAALAVAKPILSAMGSTIHHIGPTGHGAALKLAVNALFGIQVIAVAEILALMRKCGLAMAQSAEVLGSLPVMSPAAKGAAASMIAGQFSPTFPIDLVEKDFRYATLAATETAASLPMTRAALSMFTEAKARGFGGDNISGIAQLFD